MLITRIVNCLGAGGVGIHPDLLEDPQGFYQRGYDRMKEKGCDYVEYSFPFGRTNHTFLTNPLRMGQAKWEPINTELLSKLPAQSDIRLQLPFPIKNFATHLSHLLAFDDASGRPKALADLCKNYPHAVIGESVPVDEIGTPGLATAFVFPNGVLPIIPDWRVRWSIVDKWLNREAENKVTPITMPLENPTFMRFRMNILIDGKCTWTAETLDRLKPITHQLSLMNVSDAVNQWVTTA